MAQRARIPGSEPGGAAVVAAGLAGPRVGAEVLCSPPPQLPSDHADGGEEREEEDEEPVGELNMQESKTRVRVQVVAATKFKPEAVVGLNIAAASGSPFLLRHTWEGGPDATDHVTEMIEAI